MIEPHSLSATEIIQVVGRRESTVAELVGALLERIRRLEPEIQAWVWLDADGALQQAAQLDRILAGGTMLPLHGVPVGVKDIIDVAGLPTGAAFTPFHNRVAQHDAAIVARLRSLGAVIVGKAQTTQFASGDPAPTFNPWHPERTPGGSSAGSGAAVASRMVPVALGTQTAGSVLRPAAYCGVVGFKPSYDWFSRDGVLPLSWSLDHLGLIVRSIADATTLYGALSGVGPPPEAVEPPRVGLLVDFLDRSSPVAAAHLYDCTERLRRAGSTVQEVRLPMSADHLLAIHGLIMLAEIGAVHAPLFAEHPDAYEPLIRLQVEAGQLIPAAYDLQARRLRHRAARSFNQLFDQVDVFLLPTATDVPPGRKTTGDRAFQAPWTMLGMPAITLPTGLSSAGVPLATQLVGRRGKDLHLLVSARWCADRLGLISPPELG